MKKQFLFLVPGLAVLAALIAAGYFFPKYGAGPSTSEIIGRRPPTVF